MCYGEEAEEMRGDDAKRDVVGPTCSTGNRVTA